MLGGLSIAHSTDPIQLFMAFYNDDNHQNALDSPNSNFVQNYSVSVVQACSKTAYNAITGQHALDTFCNVDPTCTIR